MCVCVFATYSYIVCAVRVVDVFYLTSFLSVSFSCCGVGFLFLFVCILGVWVFYFYLNSISGSDGFSGGSLFNDVLLVKYCRWVFLRIIVHVKLVY